MAEGVSPVLPALEYVTPSVSIRIPAHFQVLLFAGAAMGWVVDVAAAPRAPGFASARLARA